jgi:hypothetical protein
MTTTPTTVVRIRTEVDSYQPASNGSGCNGIVNWEVGPECFPDDRWNDSVLVLACWWLSSLKQLQHSECSAIFRFMDGPFYIECERIGDAIHGECIDDRRGRSIVATWTQTLGSLRNQVVSFSSSVLSYCDQRSIMGSDVDQLRAKITAIAP